MCLNVSGVEYVSVGTVVLLFMHLCIVILDLFICTVPLYSKNHRRRFVIVFST